MFCPAFYESESERKFYKYRFRGVIHGSIQSAAVLTASEQERTMYYDLVKSGERIKKLRKSAGMTQERLAEAVGISVEMMGKIERGVSGTTIDTMGQIAEELSSSVDYIAFGRMFFEGMNIPEDKADMVVRVVQAILNP